MPRNVAQRSMFAGALAAAAGVMRQIIVNKTTWRLHVMDGAKLGGYPLALLTDVAPPRCDGRLTLTQGTPFPEADVTGAIHIYFTGFTADPRIPIWDGTAFAPVPFGGELTFDIHASHTDNSNYDIFGFNDAGTPRLGSGPAWASDTSRGAGAGTTEVERFNGLLVNKNAITLRNGATTYAVASRSATLLGSFGTTVWGQVQDTRMLRLLSNVFNERPRTIGFRTPGTNWLYDVTGVFRKPNNDASAEVQVLNCVAGRLADVTANAVATYVAGGSPVDFVAAIGLDSTTINTDTMLDAGTADVSGEFRTARAYWKGYPGVGRHRIALLEYANLPAGGSIRFWAYGRPGLDGTAWG